MAQMISVKTDLDETMNLLKELDGNREKMRRRILSGIGTGAKNYVKKKYGSLLNKKSGLLYRSLSSKVIRSGKAVIVSPTATHDKVRYGYVLAKGTIVEAKNRDFLTFRIGDRWIRKHSVTVPARDWVEQPVKEYLNSSSYRQKLENLVQKEVERAEKAAGKK